MWQCPKCNLLHGSAEIHRKHLAEKPECLQKTLNQDLKGWQGFDLEGIPVIVYKQAEGIPRHLWHQPKSAQEQTDFQEIWRNCAI